MSSRGPTPARRTELRAAFRHGLAWVGLCLALAAHIADEALGVFFSLYDPATRSLGQHLPFLQLPAFTFEVWLTIAVEAVIVLLILSPFAFCGARWMATLSYPFAVVTCFNGLSHVAASAFLLRAVPGLYTSPLLLAGAGGLLLSVHRLESENRRRLRS